MFQKIAFAASLLSLALSAQAESADSFPRKPIKFVTLTSAGTAGDVMARFLAEKMGPLLGTSVYVDFRGGASGQIASSQVAKSPADGYTLLLGGASSHVILPALREKMPYDSVKDFTYLGQIATAPVTLLATKDFPANNLEELIALARKNPKLQYVSWGIGSTGHLCGELLNQRKNLQIDHIPFTTGIMSALYGGQIQMAWQDGGTAVNMVQTGKVKAIAVCTSKHARLPEVQSYEELGVADASKSIGQFRWAVYAPAGLPAPVRKKLENALQQSLEKDDVRQRIIDLGYEPKFIPGDTVKSMTQFEIGEWRKIGQTAGIKLE